MVAGYLSRRRRLERKIAPTHERINTVRAEIAVLRSDVLKEFVQLEARMESRFNSIDRKLDEILRMVGDQETRITRLEQRPHGT